MNWSRAKTILIVTFLALNLFLVFELIKQSNTSIPISEYQSVNEGTLRLLKNKYGVDVTVEKLPRGASPDTSPVVGWKEVDGQSVITAMWPNTQVESSNNSIIKINNEYLMIGKNDFYYSNSSEDKRIISPEILESYIIESIKDPQHMNLISGVLKTKIEEALGLSFDYWNVDNIKKIEEEQETYYVVNFTQFIDLDVYDVGSYTRVKINSKGRIVEVKRSELEKKNNNKNFIEFIDEKIKASQKTKKITPAEALLAFVGQKPYEGDISINNIKLVYFGLKESDLIQGDNIPFKWQLKPVWKISTIDNNNLSQNYYLDAYTGKLE